MNKMIKALMKAIVIISIVIIGTQNVYAMENEKNLYDIAYGLINDYSSEVGIVVDNLIEISDNECIAELECESEDYGYIRFEIIDDNYVPIDFAIEKGVSYENVGERSGTVYEYGGAVISSGIMQGLKYSSYNRLSSTACISSSYIKSLTERYACAVVALTEIAKQEGVLKNRSIKDTFNSLWDYTWTTVDSTNDEGIDMGSTNDLMLASGMKSYVKSQGYSIKTTTKWNPEYSFFKNAVNSGYSSTLSFRLYVKDGDSYKRYGHTVNVLGWYIYKDANGKEYKYLAIADGWTSTQKYMLYEQIDFVNTYGVTYNIY